MGKKLYVGNLPFSATDQDLNDIFAQVGQVTSAKVIMDRESGRSKGFAFVEFANDDEAAKAISQFNGSDYNGRPMVVNEARPMAPREGGAGRGGFAGGAGGAGGNRRGGGFGGGERRNSGNRW